MQLVFVIKGEVSKLPRSPDRCGGPGEAVERMEGEAGHQSCAWSNYHPIKLFWICSFSSRANKNNVITSDAV